MTYEAAKKRAEPYDKIVGELPEMQRDTIDLIRRATGGAVRLCDREQPVGRECPVDNSGVGRQFVMCPRHRDVALRYSGSRFFHHSLMATAGFPGVPRPGSAMIGTTVQRSSR